MSARCINCGKRVNDPLRLFKHTEPTQKCPYCGELFSVLSRAPDNLLAFFVGNKKARSKKEG